MRPLGCASLFSIWLRAHLRAHTHPCVPQEQRSERQWLRVPRRLVSGHVRVTLCWTPSVAGGTSDRRTERASNTDCGQAPPSPHPSAALSISSLPDRGLYGFASSVSAHSRSAGSDDQVCPPLPPVSILSPSPESDLDQQI